MSDTELIRDPSGNPMAFMGIHSSCRDMARFGLMALRSGEWDGEQVVSEEWMQHATGAPSQDLNSAYGWLWWLNRPGTVLGAETASGDEAIDAGATSSKERPRTCSSCSGLGGQIIAVDPASETVVVRLGPSVYDEGVDKFSTADATLVATDAVTGDMSG